MALTVSVTPGKQFANTELITLAKLNQLGQPSFVVTGTLAAGDFTAGSVTAASTTPGAYWFVDAGNVSLTLNTYAASWVPAVTEYVLGLKLTFRANADYLDAGGTGICLLNANTIGPREIKKNGKNNLDRLDIRAGQVVDVVYDGASFQLVDPTGMPAVDSGVKQMLILGTPSDIYAAQGGNAYTLAPMVGGVNQYTAQNQLAGRQMMVQFINGNTGTATLSVNAIGNIPLTKHGGTPLIKGDIRANSVWMVTYDGTNYELVGAQPESTYYGRYGVVGFSGTNAYTIAYANGSPPVNLQQGLTVSFRAGTTSIAGGATLNVNGLGSVNFTLPGGVAVGAGDIVAGQIVTAVYNLADARFEIISPSAGVYIIPSTAIANFPNQTLSWSHGLGRAPTRVNIQVLFTGVIGSFVAGDVIGINDFNQTAGDYFTYYANATTLFLEISATAAMKFKRGQGASNMAAISLNTVIRGKVEL